MIPRIRHEQAPLRIQRDAPRVVELAGTGTQATDAFERLAGRVENLDTTVAVFADDHMAFLIDLHIVREAEFAGGRTGLAECREEFPVGSESLDTMVARVGYQHVPI